MNIHLRKFLNNHLTSFTPDYPEILIYEEYIYLIGCDEIPNRIKIGRTRELQRRIKDMQGGCPVTLKLLAHILVLKHAPRWERHLHDSFNVFRWQREWFDLPPKTAQDLVDYFFLASANGQALLPYPIPKPSKKKPAYFRY